MQAISIDEWTTKVRSTHRGDYVTDAELSIASH